MSLRITTLIENNTDKNNVLINEHGLSLYIEINEKKILFDTGQSGEFINYLKEKNISIFRLSHCTGDKAVERLKDEFRDKFIYNNTGNVIEAD